MRLLIDDSYHLAIDSKEPLMSRLIRTHLPTIQKTATYYVMHVTVAIGVAYAVTGDLRMSLTLSLLEPTVQAFAFFFHERAWTRRSGSAAGTDWTVPQLGQPSNP